MTTIGPNGEQFLSGALPGAKGGNVLAVGEYHSLSDHINFLRNNLGTLKSDHNLGTIGIEYSAFMNVFIWAAHDHNLPMPEGKEAEYLEDRFKNYADADYRNNAVALAQLTMQASQTGINITAYDGRYTLKDFQTKITTVPFESLLKDVQALIDKYPEYGTRLNAMEDIIFKGREAGLSPDVISAALLAGSLKTGKNAVTIGGKAHINGLRLPEYDVQGIFHEALRSEGYTVTPTLISSANDMKNFWIASSSPGGVLYDSIQSYCNTHANINLYIFDSDIVIPDIAGPLNPSVLMLQDQKSAATSTPSDNDHKNEVAFSCTDSKFRSYTQEYPGAGANPLNNPKVAAAVSALRGILPLQNENGYPSLPARPAPQSNVPLK